MTWSFWNGETTDWRRERFWFHLKTTSSSSQIAFLLRDACTHVQWRFQVVVHLAGALLSQPQTLPDLCPLALMLWTRAGVKYHCPLHLSSYSPRCSSACSPLALPPVRQAQSEIQIKQFRKDAVHCILNPSGGYSIRLSAVLMLDLVTWLISPT